MAQPCGFQAPFDYLLLVTWLPLVGDLTTCCWWPDYLLLVGAFLLLFVCFSFVFLLAHKVFAAFLGLQSGFLSAKLLQLLSVGDKIVFMPAVKVTATFCWWLDYFLLAPVLLLLFVGEQTDFSASKAVFATFCWCYDYFLLVVTLLLPFVCV